MSGGTAQRVSSSGIHTGLTQCDLFRHRARHKRQIRLPEAIPLQKSDRVSRDTMYFVQQVV